MKARPTFRERIRAAIANPVLQAALDANAQRRVEARTRALASLPDYEARRQQAAAVRTETIAHLDEHLERFIANLKANGIIVHRAQDAAEAQAIVLSIINQPRGVSSQKNGRKLYDAMDEPHSGGRPPKASKGKISQQPRALRGYDSKLIAKSKSMVSEEIGLNEALEAAGHRVVETDLGEYIVQLRGEKPSHIITPAVHLRRQEVAQLFQEKLGLPYTEDVAALTAAARRELREVFLHADVGISGVNFGVAESGSLCIITNEGNGRMVTTLPPVHIALMGMERLVPALDDLALMLSLLPRSATGQKITVYTQLIQGPLAGQERHLVILDNRRSALRASPLAESLHCIRCGACLNACPAFREIGGHAYDSVYPGPIGSVISAGLFGAEYTELAYACSLCGACAEVCPVKIPLPDLLVRVRAGASPPGDEKRKGSRKEVTIPRSLIWGLKLYRFVATHPRLYHAAQGALGLFTRRRDYLPLPAWTGWGLSKDLPVPTQTPFRARWREGGAGNKGNRRHRSEIPPTPQSPDTQLSVPHSPEEAFAEAITELGGVLIPCTPETLTGEILNLLHERDVRHVHGWEEIPALDVAFLRENGITWTTEPAADAPIGVTGALAGIAETGTLVIPGGAARPLTASLLPGTHIAVLRATDILSDLASAFHLPAVTEQPATVLISGPSRTADIEMTLTIGVHGPGELIIFLVSDETPHPHPGAEAAH